MAKMKSLVTDLQDAISTGATYAEIARQFDVPVKWVFEAADMMDDMESNPEPDYMDGDFDSAMASAGYGMDEDYGYAEDVL